MNQTLSNRLNRIAEKLWSRYERERTWVNLARYSRVIEKKREIREKTFAEKGECQYCKTIYGSTYCRYDGEEPIQEGNIYQDGVIGDELVILSLSPLVIYNITRNEEFRLNDLSQEEGQEEYLEFINSLVLLKRVHV